MKNRIQARSRRGFLRQFLVQAHHLVEEARGHQQCSLLELKKLDDDALAPMIPIWRAGYSIVTTPDGLEAKASHLDAPQRTALSEDERIAMEVFAAGHTLDAIAGWVSRRTGRDRPAAFRIVRDLFLRLCDLGWAHPVDDPREREP